MTGCRRKSPVVGTRCCRGSKLRRAGVVALGRADRADGDKALVDDNSMKAGLGIKPDLAASLAPTSLHTAAL